MTSRVLFQSPQEVSAARLPTKLLVKTFIIGGIFELWMINTSSNSLLDYDEPTLNYAPIILGIVTIFALISWFFTPATAWVPRGRLSRPVEGTE
ncbi:hypothetical protein ACN42_g3882 [Penicillium freii]|uniref:Uncharacterized protein n=1 Tax=Penicillium freii TaxID=48697 RepID=A0A117NPZ5_PENFR|nr:hypothetical protein ACN42_g3882 [Penicillium freii]